MNKKKFNALEKLFSASIESGVEKDDRLSIVQSRAKIYKELESEGLCESVIWQDEMLRVSGYVITHKGHFVYCENCKDLEDV